MRRHALWVLLIVAAALPLDACTSAAEREAQAREVAASDDAACRESGVKPGTRAYDECRAARVDALAKMIASPPIMDQSASQRAAAIRAKTSSDISASTARAVQQLEQIKIDIPQVRVPTVTMPGR